MYMAYYLLILFQYVIIVHIRCEYVSPNGTVLFE